MTDEDAKQKVMNIVSGWNREQLLRFIEQVASFECQGEAAAEAWLEVGLEYLSRKEQ